MGGIPTFDEEPQSPVAGIRKNCRDIGVRSEIIDKVRSETEDSPFGCKSTVAKSHIAQRNAAAAQRGQAGAGGGVAGMAPGPGGAGRAGPGRGIPPHGAQPPH